MEFKKGVMKFSQLKSGLSARFANQRGRLDLRNKGIVFVIVLIILALGVYQIVLGNSSVNGESEKISVAPPVDEVIVERELTFALRDESGAEVSRVKYMIESAELRDELLIKGTKAVSIDGRTFLVLNLKITNDFNRAIEVDSRDYVRLSVNGDSIDWMAADIHNDPVSVQPISTKLTRIAFPVNDTDRDFILRVGEIRGEKEDITLELEYK